jgi:hypothetical protein
VALFLYYVILQAMDAATTLIFLAHGVQEANPLIRLMLAWCGSAAVAILLAKLFAVLLGVYAWKRKRVALLRKMNWLFAACVAWNIAAIVRAY